MQSRFWWKVEEASQLKKVESMRCVIYIWHILPIISWTGDSRMFGALMTDYFQKKFDCAIALFYVLWCIFVQYIKVTNRRKNVSNVSLPTVKCSMINFTIHFNQSVFIQILAQRFVFFKCLCCAIKCSWWNTVHCSENTPFIYLCRSSFQELQEFYFLFNAQSSAQGLLVIYVK